MSSNRGNQIALKQFAINQYKEEYERKDYNQDKLNDIKQSLKSNNPDNSHKKKQYELRVKAINQLLE